MTEKLTRKNNTCLTSKAESLEAVAESTCLSFSAAVEGATVAETEVDGETVAETEVDGETVADTDDETWEGVRVATAASPERVDCISV